jgi:competence protein ComEC
MTPLSYAGIAWLIGIWLGSLLALPLYAWLGLAATTVGVAVVARVAEMRPSYQARLALTCAAVLALGAVRLVLAQPRFTATSLATYNDWGWLTLTGVVAGEPDVRDTYVAYKVDVQQIVPDTAESEPLAVHGAAQVRGPRYPVYHYGDRVQVSGLLETPSAGDDFNYRDYLARRNVHSYVRYAEVERLTGGGGSGWKRAMLAWKDRARATIARILPEPEASLLTGILLGVETGIPRDLMDDFNATGTSHVIAISGFNITIVVGLLMATLGRLVRNRWTAAGIALLGVALYTVLVGADAAVVRAAVMGGVAVIGVAVQRPGTAHNTLAAAALLMTALNPFTLWDAGFQLSVAATLGLILYAQRFEAGVQGVLARRLSTERAERIVGWSSDAVLLTLAAQITTTPLILWHFGRLSLVTFLTNLLILPVQSLVMLCGGLATLAGLLWEPLGRFLGWAAYLWLTWTIRVVEWTAGFPHASVAVKLSDLGLVAVYAAIGGLTWLALADPDRRRTLWEGVQARLPLKLALGGTALVAVVAWLGVLQFPDGRLHVTFLDVGQGDAIFIQTPGGAQILVDGGPEGSALLAGLGRQLPFWDRTLDLVVLTHPDSDHLGGLVPLLERYDVRTVLARVPESAEVPPDRLVTAWQAAVAAEGATAIRGEAGTRLELSDGVTLEVLHPGLALVEGTKSDSNNNSLVLRLCYRDVAILLPGDIEEEVERALVRSDAPLASTVLKVPHHGSDTSSSAAFLAAVRPQVAVVSVGEGNDFGHPSGEVLARLAGRKVFRTDEDGTISVTTNGHTLWIQAER